MSTLPLRHPLRREGASQITRLVQALRPEAFRLDERTLQDLIVATHRYAQTLRYFDDTDSHPEGASWDRFWEVEPLTYLAVLAATDTNQIRSAYEDADTALTREQQAAPPPGARPAGKSMPPAAYRPLIRYLREIAWTLEDTYRKLVRLDHPLRHLLLDRIKRDNRCDREELEGALKRLIAYHKGADPALKMSDYEAFFAGDKHWGLAQPGRVDYDAIPANPNMNQNALRELFITFYDTWAVLKAAAQTAFDKELTRMELPEEVEFRIVQPHVALYLAFLRLFRHAQDSFNELGAGHLDFFYEKILGLQPRAESPDDVYLLFELAKNVDEFLLEKGTELLAGKDDTGKPLLYETIEEWVLRSARVADIRNTCIDLESGQLLANPDVRKQYSAHAEVPNEKAAHWRAFGDDAGLPLGEMGFAIASPQLILKEGKRVVDVKIYYESALDLNLDRYEIQAYLSSSEKWIDLSGKGPEDNTKVEITKISQTGPLEIKINLERDDPPVMKLGDDLIRKEKLNTEWPILKLVFKIKASTNNGSAETAIRQLISIKVNTINISVEVKDIRENLIIQSDQGIFDGTQKIFPFGMAPETNNRFYIGSTEVFQKELNTLKIKFDWIAPPENMVEYYKDYKKCGVTLPNPYILFSLINRSDISLITQIQIKEEIVNSDNPFPYYLKGIIRDMYGKPLAGVEIISGGIEELRPQTAEDGTFMVTIANRTSIEFNKTEGDYETVKVERILRTDENNATLITKFVEIALLPKHLAYKKFSEEGNNKVMGRIKDIYGNILPKIKVTPDENTSFSVSSKEEYNEEGFNFEIPNLPAIPHKLEFVAEDAASVFKPLEFETKNFSLFDVTLYPKTDATVYEIKPPVNAFSGVVLEFNGQPMANVRVKGSGEKFDQTTTTDSQGVFSFSSTGNNIAKIEFFFAGEEAPQGFLQKENTAFLLLPPKITVKDSIDREIISGTVTILDKTAENGRAPLQNVSVISYSRYFLMDQNGNITERRIPIGYSQSDDKGQYAVVRGACNYIVFKYKDFESIEFETTGVSDYDILFFPVGIKRIQNGTITDVFNEAIDGVEIRVNTDESAPYLTCSKAGGKYEIELPDLGDPDQSFILYTYPEFEPLKIPFSKFYNTEAPLSGSLLNTRLYYNYINYKPFIRYNSNNNIGLINEEFDVNLTSPSIKRDVSIQAFTKYSPTIKRGFIRLTLQNGDFLHKEYQKVLLWYAINAGKEGKVVIPEDGSPVCVPPVPNPPYTPATNGISLDYSSTQIITGANNLDAENSPIDQYFQLLPFQGHKQIDISSPPNPQIRLLYPYLPNDDAPERFANGNLFIGLSDLTPGGSLSLLVQVAEGTEAEPEAPAPEIRWSYLAKDNCWRPFGANADGARIIRDNTAGLTRSGIIQFSIPTTIVRENTLLDPDYYWLRAAIAEELDDKNNKVKSAGALPSIISIDAQAVQARFKNRDNDLRHLAAPLPAGTISKMADTSTAVKSVTQPLESFGGRAPEKTGLEFYYRVSERLRHKDRAVTVWDHERLLLERFPEIAAAKCIPHAQYPNEEPLSERAPGFVTVAVIPDLKKRKGEPWPEPRFTLGDLEDMRNYLSQHANPLVAFKMDGKKHFRRLQIINPLYEKLDVEVHVQFKPEVADLEQKTEQLRTALTYYISPWRAEAAKPPAFGRVLERSGILQFIEEQPYVDYIELTDEGGENIFITKLAGVQTPAEAEKIRPGTARSIIVAGSVCVNEKLPSEPPPSPSVPVPDPAAEKPPAEGKKAAKPGKPKSAPKQRK